jgi:hypothetical protein
MGSILPWVIALHLLAGAPIFVRHQVSRTTSSSSSAGTTDIISPVTAATYFFRPGDNRPELQLLVLWRGAPGWFLAGPSSMSVRQGGRVGTTTVVRFGAVELTLALDPAKKTATIQGKTVELLDNNVVLVDEVDRPGGGVVVEQLRVDPSVPDSPAIVSVLRRSPRIVSFLRCGVLIPQTESQAMVNEVCSRLK